MTGSGFGGELFLINLDVTESLDYTCMHNKYHKQDHQSVKKINQAYSKVILDLDDS